MKLLPLLFALIASSVAYPFENAENVALDTAHEAHDGITPAAEKPVAVEVASSDLAKTTEGVPSDEILKAESNVELKVEQNAEPTIALVKDAAESKPVVALLAEPVSALEDPVVVELAAESKLPVQEPEATLPTIADKPTEADDTFLERAGRAYEQQQFNNDAAYGSWMDNRPLWNSYSNDFGYIPYFRYPRYYPHSPYIY